MYVAPDIIPLTSGVDNSNPLPCYQAPDFVRVNSGQKCTKILLLHKIDGIVSREEAQRR